MLTGLSRDVGNAYLTVCSQQSCAKRCRLLRYLNDHTERPVVIAWLRENGDPIWTEYLNSLEGI